MAISEELIQKMMELSAHRSKLRKWAETNEALARSLKRLEAELMDMGLRPQDEAPAKLSAQITKTCDTIKEHARKLPVLAGGVKH